MKSLLLFICGVMFSINAKGQNYPVWIDSVKVIPQFITQNDTPFFITFVQTGNLFNRIDSSIQTYGDTIRIEVCYYKSPATAGEQKSDTFSLDDLPIGNYTVMYLGKSTPAGFFDSTGTCFMDSGYDTAIVNFTIHPAVNIKENTGLIFALAPNPATNTITIQLPDITSTAQLKLFNTVGEVVLQQTTNQSNTTINISMLPAGIYFVQVEAESGSGVKKLVVE